MPKAAPSGRAANKVNLMLTVPVGDLEIPVAVPVSLYTGTVSDHGITRSRYVHNEALDEDHEVGSKNYDKITGDDVEFSQIVNKIHTEYGPVFVEDHELEELFETTPDTIVVKTFQPLHMFHQGHYVPKSLQFLEPQITGTGKKKGHDVGAVKVLNVLLDAMRKEGACLLVDVTTRGVPKPAILTPDGALWFVYHTDALREQREMPEYEASDAEVAQFAKMIKANWSTEVQDLTDERSALIQAHADDKAAEGDFGRPEAPTDVEKKAPAGQDVMALLMASVEAAETKAKSA